MKRITIEKTKSIQHLKFTIPQSHGVYLLVGANGSGKTTLLVCLERICNPNGFARGFSASKSFEAVDQYKNSSIKYEMDNSPVCLLFRKKLQDEQYLPRRKVDCYHILAFHQAFLLKWIRIE